ncbi:MAG TPA: alanine--glyoxylate aminotransferase family protein [Planktothrix sp.]|jgi:aspartate aminotransferase-like enzyme
MSGIQPREFLAIPGPTPVPDAVLEAVARHPIGHRTADFSKIFVETLEGLQWLGETKNDVFILTSSGTGAMEAALSNIINPGDRVISLVCGVFSERWAKIAEAFGAQVERLSVPNGKPYSLDALQEKLDQDKEKSIKAVTITHNETSTGVVNDLQAIAALVKAHGAVSIVDAVTSFGATPLPIDQWGIDVLVCGSQKALMLPPGLAVIFFSERAWQANASCKTHRFYHDLKKYKKSVGEKSTPFTPNVSLIAGLHTALRMMKEEGTAAIFARHTRMRDALRGELAAMGLKLFVDEDAASPSITAIYPPGDLTVDSIRKSMRERFKILTADGQEELKGKIFRIGHMGYVFDRDMQMVVAALRSVLVDLGHNVANAPAKTAAR